MSSESTSSDTCSPATVLVIAPHPDDEVLGCGGSLLLHSDTGRVVHVLYLTSGERGSPHHTADELRRVREAEATAAARALGIPVSRLRFARFPDGGIQPTDLDQLAAVVRLLREVRPDLVYLPHAQDASSPGDASSPTDLTGGGSPRAREPGSTDPPSH